jgi:hypothetical protein
VTGNWQLHWISRESAKPFPIPVFGILPNAPSAFYGQEYGSNAFDFGVGQFGASSNFDIRPLGSQSQDTEAAMFSGYQHEPQNNAHCLISAREDILPPAMGLIDTVAQETVLPPELPYLLKGIESDTQKCLFWHFTHVMSPLLTTSKGESNPMNSEVIPLAMRNRTVMKTILCLAASHRLKPQQTGLDELCRERDRLHEDVCAQQSHRIQTFDPGSRTSKALLFSVPDQEIVALRLCSSVSTKSAKAPAIKHGELTSTEHDWRLQ